VNRPDNQTRIMTQLDLLRVYVTCTRLRVASALVSPAGLPVITSVNGAPMGIQHCNDRPAAEGRCVVCIHSEKNAINKAARYGISTFDFSLWTTHRPCVSCANDIVQVGIEAVYYRWDYDTDGQKDYVIDLFERSLIAVIQLEYTEEEKAFNDKLNEWATWI
jgi:dCMP deaminase